MDKKVITIGRQFGSGGRAIGKMVAERLGIPFYDKEIIREIAKESGYSHAIINEYDEKPTNSFLYSLSLGAYNHGPIVAGMHDMPISDKIFILQSNIIKDLAEQGPCVIIGRCAESVLRDKTEFLSVFVHASDDYRAKRVAEYENISKSAAAELVRKTDKKRANYHNYYSDLRWGDATAYDLCVNGELGIENAVELIIKAAEMK